MPKRVDKKKEKTVSVRLELEPYELFKDWAFENRTNMSDPLEAYILTVIKGYIPKKARGKKC